MLVVDDNADFADITARLLRAQGFEVHTRYTGAQGLAEAESLRPDALLLDIGMPYIDGYEVCRQIRAQPWGSGKPSLPPDGIWPSGGCSSRTEAGFDDHFFKR